MTNFSGDDVRPNALRVQEPCEVNVGCNEDAHQFREDVDVDADSAARWLPNGDPTVVQVLCNVVPCIMPLDLGPDFLAFYHLRELFRSE